MQKPTIFEKHYKNGFNTNWSDDIENFTVADWREFLILTYKIQFLGDNHHPDVRKQYPHLHEAYEQIHASIDPAFWENLKWDPDASTPFMPDDLRQAAFKLNGPLGMIVSGPPGTATTIEATLLQFMMRTKTSTYASDAVREKFIAALGEAIEAYDQNRYVKRYLMNLNRCVVDWQQQLVGNKTPPSLQPS